MPINPTYPGVYIEEVASGVRTITGVATSITAFIGRALRGPVNQAATINNYGDFERIFGGLWIESTLGYAVRDFYFNGGSQGIIVRLFHENFPTKEALSAARQVAAATTGTDAGAAATAAEDEAKKITDDSKKQKTAAKIVADTAKVAAALPGATADSVRAAAFAVAPLPKAKLTIDAISLEAAYEGAWGNNLRATIDLDVSEDVAKRMGLTKGDLFNLTVIDTAPGGATERFINLTFKDSPRRIDKVLEAESKLVRWYSTWPPNPLPTPAASNDDIVKDEKDLAAKQKTLDDLKKADPQDPTAIAGAQSAVDAAKSALANAKRAMDASDGQSLTIADYQGSETSKEGIFALEKADLFNLLCIPHSLSAPEEIALWPVAASYCEKRRAMLLVDAPVDWIDKAAARTKFNDSTQDRVVIRSKNAAVFFPRLRQPNPLRDNQMENFAPCGVVAGIFARTDTQRGVWKAPAGLDATLVGVPQLSVSLDDDENGELNPLGINCLRTMPAAGRVIWGARTLQGADRLASEWKYIPVRRLALFIEESLYRGTQWVVFEPNDEPLWAQIRLNVGAFMQNLFRQGAFQGRTRSEAYFVKCDKETTTQNDINLGIVNIVVGFAPLKPAEFVIIQIQQMAGQIEA